MSLVHLGKKPPTDQSPAALILDCHARIRSFSELAVRLAAKESSEAEVRDAAERVHRYFTQALPLHVADEEQSLAPRLRKFAPETFAALATMEREHRAHDQVLARLIPAWDALRSDARARGDTLADALLLRDQLEAHLVAEERLVIPALSRLPEDQQHVFVEELRARRDP